MAMGRRSWVGLALATVLAASVVAASMAPVAGGAVAPRPTTVTEGLDFLHAHQRADGGFGSMANTSWGILGAVASGERMSSSLWTHAGKSPFSYLQANNHDTAASGYDVPNPTIYYARTIMAYVAAGHPERVFMAGTPRVDLLGRLYSYQDMTDGSPTRGSFSPSSSSRSFQAVHTTAWAILAMHAMSEDGTDRYAAAVGWLAGQQDPDGGFPDQSSASSNLEDTALAIQALAPTGHGAIISAARQYLKAGQNPDGGFPYAPHKPTDGTATAAVIQAIVAMGEHQYDAFWQAGGHSPAHGLAGLQRATGGYADRTADAGATVDVTGWALVALSGKAFTSYPRSPGPAAAGFIYKPRIRTAEPKNKAKFTSTRSVLVKATYTDGRGGTGVNPKAVRVYVDKVNRTSHAKVSSSSLRLQLENVPNGVHTYTLRIVDHAGNARLLERTFTVLIPTPAAPGPITPTFTPNPYPTATYPPPTTSPTPSTTLYPSSSATPYPSASSSPGTQPIYGTPVSSPSASPRPTGAGSSGGGSAAGFVGGTLLAMLPIGAAVSYLAFSRREHALDPAGDGEVLGGGGSTWDRLKQSLAKTKDLVKPAGR